MTPIITTTIMAILNFREWAEMDREIQLYTSPAMAPESST